MHNKSWMIDRPSRGKYETDCLRWQEGSIRALGDREVLVRTIFLSLDPTSRNWLKLESHSMYLPLAVGKVMLGVAVGVVVTSRAPEFSPGDFVTGLWGWELYSIPDIALLQRIDPAPGLPLESYLSVFSHVGRAAVIGMLEVGALKPSDTVLVSGAAGATGSLAAQVAKAHGCRVIGIAGGQDKCRFLLQELKLDAAIDYQSEDINQALHDTCPDGVDLYFDNVGGPILDAVLANMAVGCRIVICGAMSQYDLAEPAQAYGCRNLPQLIYRQGRIQGFVVPQFAARYAEFDAILHRLFAEGKLLNRSHIIDGLEQAPEALKLLLTGSNDGKLMIRVSMPELAAY
ncbi:MAG: NADP-dependent oxidoreductase [Steroidobacteraceae bacterium]